MATSSPRIEQIVNLLSVASTPEIVRRAFFQLNDDLARADKAGLLQLQVPVLPENSERAALIAAAFAYRYQQVGAEAPPWLASPDLVSDTPVHLTSGLEELTQSLTPPVVSQYNVFVDQASFGSG